MSTSIEKDQFTLLRIGDKLYNSEKIFEIERINCEEYTLHPTYHVFIENNGVKVYHYIFHDGEDIKYFSEDPTIHGTAIEDLKIARSLRSFYRTMRMNNLTLIGTGRYCTECGGLCGNSNHDSKLW